jgi:hypothetical protein
MAKKKSSSGGVLSQLFNQNGVKAILGVVAAGSFAIAFGQEKIQQFVSNTGSSSNSACLDQFYRDVPPYLMKESLDKHSYPLCTVDTFFFMETIFTRNFLAQARRLKLSLQLRRLNNRVICTNRIN